jgi:hypothetical protein
MRWAYALLRLSATRRRVVRADFIGRYPEVLVCIPWVDAIEHTHHGFEVKAFAFCP